MIQKKYYNWLFYNKLTFSAQFEQKHGILLYENFSGGRIKYNLDEFFNWFIFIFHFSNSVSYSIFFFIIY